MDASDGVALWRLIADQIEEEIRQGAIDHRLPTEAAFASRFGVNRHTVRRAIGALTDAGWVETVRGKGSFARRAAPARLPYPIGSRTRFSENIARASATPGGRLVRADIAPADAPLARDLACHPGDPLHRLETLSIADGVALSVATSWLVVADFPDIVRAYAETGSFTQALRAQGVPDYLRGETRLTAERITMADAQLMGCEHDAIVMIARAVDMTVDHRPVQVIRTRFFASRIEFVFRKDDPAKA